MGNNGSARESSREGDNTKSTRTGVYAINNPSGFLMFNWIDFRVTPKFKLAPAESPGRNLICKNFSANNFERYAHEWCALESSQ